MSEHTRRLSSQAADGGSGEQHFPQREQPVLRPRDKRQNFKGFLQLELPRVLVGPQGLERGRRAGVLGPISQRKNKVSSPRVRFSGFKDPEAAAVTRLTVVRISEPVLVGARRALEGLR